MRPYRGFSYLVKATQDIHGYRSSGIKLSAFPKTARWQVPGPISPASSSYKYSQDNSNMTFHSHLSFLRCVNTVLSIAGLMEWVKTLGLLSTFVPMQQCNLNVCHSGHRGGQTMLPSFRTFLTGSGLQRTEILPSKKTSLSLESYALFFNCKWHH